MPPPGHEPFLRAICDDPADDTVRLAYADWLDENGDPTRAEFIRLQIAVPNRPAEKDPDLRFFRAMMLFAVNRAKWLAELPAWDGVTWHPDMRRGFAYGGVMRSGRWWVQHREHVLRAVPLQFLGLRDASPATIERSLNFPQADRLTEFALLNSRIIHDQLAAVANCPRLTELRVLSIRRPSARRRLPGVPLTAAGARALVRTRHLPKLESIHLDGTIGLDVERILLTRLKSVRCQRRGQE